MEPHCSADAVGNTRDGRRVPAGGRGCSTGEYAGNIFWVVGFALIVSWIVAVVFTPYLGVKMLPAIKPIEGGTTRSTTHANYRRLRRLITFAVRHKFVTVGIVGIAFALSGVGMGALKQQFFPTSDRPEVLVEVRLPEGTSIETTTAAVEKLEHWLDDQPEAKVVTSYVGQGAPRFSSRWRRNCLILPSPRSSCPPDAEAREALKHRLREAVSQGLPLRPMCASLSLCSDPTRRFLSSFGSWDLIPRNYTTFLKKPSTSCGASRTCGRPTAIGAIARPYSASSRIRIG